jgi:hypothetical protein
MNNQSQSHARAMPVVRLAELKPSVSTVAAHKHLVDARIVFDGSPLLNRSFFSVGFTGHCGRKSQNAFCVPDTSLPVCLRVGFQFGGWINERNGEDTLFQNGTKPFENQLKSLLCLVP